ncbi:hypothetical protein CYY_006852 [Polysphondylium violaceum]|uniref:DNA/RNA-binding protein Alba-like domain-containing protein n=1 Tax=Polysphondylium violaceum TaxID=133409 RepID=A0A8J4UY05_9MYCE|nr:hypothetical protein CYY_006852 [Polysphondylium violaceum]
MTTDNNHDLELHDNDSVSSDDDDELLMDEKDKEFQMINDPTLYTYVRRVVQRPQTNKNDIYISTNGKYIYYVKRAKQLLFTQGLKEITIHGLGSAIGLAVKLSLYLERNIGGLVLSPTTSTEEIIDQYDPLVNDLEPVLKIRHCSSIHIKILKNSVSTGTATTATTTPTTTTNTQESVTEESSVNPLSIYPTSYKSRGGRNNRGGGRGGRGGGNSSNK